MSGASFAIGVPFVASWFATERQGWALGLYGVGTAGTALSAFTMPALFEGPGRAVAGVIYAIVLGSFAAISLLLARDAKAERPQPPPLGKVLRLGPAMWQLALFYFVTFGGFVVVAAVVARPIGGWLSDRIGGYKVATIAFFGIGVDAVGLAWQASDPVIVPVTILCLTMAFFLGLDNGAVFKLVPQRFPQATGAVTGIVGAAGGLGGFFPPLVLGIVKDATDTYVMAFVFLVSFAWMCAGLAVMLAAGERRPDMSQPEPGT